MKKKDMEPCEFLNSIQACRKHPDYRLLKEPWTSKALAIDFAKKCDNCAMLIVEASHELLNGTNLT